MSALIFAISFYYLLGALGAYVAIFKDLHSNWKYLLSLLWVIVLPCIGMMGMLVLTDRNNL